MAKVDLEMLISLGSLIAMAMLMIILASLRFRHDVLNSQAADSYGTSGALAVPVVASIALFTIYVFLRFVPAEYFNALASTYASVMAMYLLGAFLEHYTKPTILTGTFCVAVTGVYMWTGNWVASNVLAIGTGAASLAITGVDNFTTAFITLFALFFYDIFWVFGTDVMIAVATNIKAPVLLTFPHHIFGDHSPQSLLGIGDMFVPGLFICQTLTFSRDVAKRGNLYFYVAMVSYFLALVNTMAIMLVFEHGQPALLYIVPWLFLTFMATAIYCGDVKLAWEYEAASLALAPPKPEGEITSTEDTVREVDADTSANATGSILGELWSLTLHLFGLDSSGSDEAKGGAKTTPAAIDTEKKNT